MIFKMKKDLSLGEKIRILRIKMGMNQAQLASKFNVSPSTIGMYEQNRREPSRSMMLKFCNFFGVTMNYLTGYEFSSKKSEVTEIVEDFIRFFENQNDLTRNGKLITEKEKFKIVQNLRNTVRGIHYYYNY